MKMNHSQRQIGQNSPIFFLQKIGIFGSQLNIILIDKQKGEIQMYDNDDEPKLLRGLLNALLIEAFSVVVIIGLCRIITQIIFHINL